MQIEIVRHHGGPDDSNGDQKHRRIDDQRRRRQQPGHHFEPVRPCQYQKHREAHRHHQHQEGHQAAQLAIAEAQGKHNEGPRTDDQDARQQTDPEQELQGNGAADQLGKVGRDHGDLGQEPQQHHDRPREGLAADLGQPLARDNAQPHAERLRHGRDQVRQQNDRQQLETVTGASAEISRPVSRIDIAHRDQDAGTDQAESSPAFLASEML